MRFSSNSGTETDWRKLGGLATGAGAGSGGGD